MHTRSATAWTSWWATSTRPTRLAVEAAVAEGAVARRPSGGEGRHRSRARAARGTGAGRRQRRRRRWPRWPPRPLPGQRVAPDLARVRRAPPPGPHGWRRARRRAGPCRARRWSRRSLLPAPRRRPRLRRAHLGTPVRARPRDAAPRVDPRRQQRVPRHHGNRHPRHRRAARRRPAPTGKCPDASRPVHPHPPRAHRGHRHDRRRHRGPHPDANQGRHDDHARHPRLVRGVEVGAGRVHEADRHHG